MDLSNFFADPIPPYSLDPKTVEIVISVSYHSVINFEKSMFIVFQISKYEISLENSENQSNCIY